jgi:hypothetical protein
MPYTTDTNPIIEEMMINGYRSMTPAEKLSLSWAMTKAVRKLATARIKKQHIGISDRELQLRLASLWLDRDTMVKAFGWDPEKEGY